MTRVRHTIRVDHATRLPIDIATEHGRVRLAIVMHKYELLTEPIHEIAEIAPRTLLDRGSRPRVVIRQVQELSVTHTHNDDGSTGGRALAEP